MTRKQILLSLTLAITALAIVANVGAGLFKSAEISTVDSTPRLAAPQPKVINHSCTNLGVIPASWITKVKASMNLHYCHRSHGGQLLVGAQALMDEDPTTYPIEIGYTAMPSTAGVHRILDGQARPDEDTYIYPEMYWATQDGLDNTTHVLTTYTVNVSMWSWCNELEGWSEAEVDAYLANITALEAANPDTVFVYMTENAQSTDWAGYNRASLNEQIRQYCIDNDKWLFDFEDLDAWCGTEFNSYTY